MQFDITRAWKDEEYRESLSQEQQAQLESPAGELELSEAELELINGTGDGFGGKGGKGGYTEGYGFTGGVVGNSKVCGNFSIRPTTNLNLGEDNKFKDENQSLLGTVVKVVVGGADHRRAVVNRFDFSCSVSFGGICFSGEN